MLSLDNNVDASLDLRSVGLCVEKTIVSLSSRLLIHHRQCLSGQSSDELSQLPRGRGASYEMSSGPFKAAQTKAPST